MTKKPFKLHIGARHYHVVNQKPKKPSVISRVGAFLYEVSYRVGLTIIFTIQKSVLWVQQNIKQVGVQSGSYAKLFKQKQFRSSLLVLVLFSLAVMAGFKSAKLVAVGLELKGKVLGIATIGTQHLLDAQKLLESKDVQGAQNQFVLALQSFKTSKEQFNQTNDLVKGLVSLLPQKKDADSLLTSAQLISKSGVELVNFYNDLSHVSISPAGLESDVPIKDLIEDANSQLSNSIQDIGKADDLIGSISESSLPSGYAASLGQIKSKISTLEKSLNNFQDILSVGEGFIMGRKKILLVFENNNELRATGGFIGTYGAADVVDGKINNLKVSSIYDLDGQLKENIVPPTPVLNVETKWYMRDANWFANFPESAYKLSNFYEKEGGETPDIVIALTPKIITDLLKLTGPISMPAYHVTLDADNFVEATQVTTSINYSKDTNTPKQMLADFVPALLQRLTTISKDNMEQVLTLLQQNLNNKQIVFYSRDKDLQSRLEAFNWAGTVIPTDRDYLSVVNSNLGGTKTDLYMDQSVHMESMIDDQGNVTNHVTITRTNKLPKMDNTENLSFMRIYVPLGSTLVSNTGFDYKNLDTRYLEGFKTDREVNAWEKSAVKDITTGTFIGTESGKTYFGNWLEVPGASSKTVELTYRLPFKVQKTDRFSLLVQKQIGALNSTFDYTLYFNGRNLAWENFAADTISTGTLQVKTSLDKDYFYGVVLNKP